MKTKLFSQNNVGGALLLLFFLVISQTRLFDLFIHTVLGRMILIILLIITSYLNKILGVVLVLIVIICFNNKYNYYMEGFDSSGNAHDASGNMKDASGNAQDASGNRQPPIAAKKNDASGNSVEGFDVLGIENNLKRGKNSNSISYNSNSRRSDYVEPYHDSMLNNNNNSYFQV